MYAKENIVIFSREANNFTAFLCHKIEDIALIRGATHETEYKDQNTQLKLSLNKRKQ